MAWYYWVGAALSGLSKGGMGSMENVNVDVANTLNEAQTYSNNLLRAANNKVVAARGSLARYKQSLDNQRVMRNTGEAINAINVNYRRRRDAVVDSSVEGQVMAAEQAGMTAATAASSGLTGGVADMVASAVAMSSAKREARRDRTAAMLDSDAAKALGDTLVEGMGRLDQRQVGDRLDYSNSVFSPLVRAGNFLSDFMGGATRDNTGELLRNATKENQKEVKDSGSDWSKPGKDYDWFSY